MKKTQQLEQLWKQYQKNQDNEIREQLIITYVPLVKYVAGRMSLYFGKNVEYDDLIGNGIFGLIDAIDKYDVNKGFKFETYASLRIKGAILDGLREQDWVPRSIRQKQKELENAYKILETEYGRPAADEEIISFLGITEKEFYDLINKVNMGTIMSLDEIVTESGELNGCILSNQSTDTPEYHIQKQQLKKMLNDSISFLPEKEKKVVMLYYFEELTLKEIGKILEVSESRICQLHSKALLRMKGRLSKYRHELYANS